MSKLIEHAAFLTQDPENEDFVIFNIPIRIKKNIVEAGFFELAAIGKGWEQNIPSPQFLIDWVKNEGRKTALEVGIRQVSQQAASSFVASVEGDL